MSVIRYPKQLRTIKWTTNSKGILFPKINNYNIYGGFTGRDVHGCALYWKVKKELRTEVKKLYSDSKLWTSSEFPYYYESLSIINKGNHQPRLMGAFGDFFIYIDGFGYMIEIDEDGAHSTNSAAYFKGDISKLIAKREADLGKDQNLYLNGITSIHCTEHESLQNVLDTVQEAHKHNLKVYAKTTKQNNASNRIRLR